MTVVALAGHVDHGKSALVQALTGARTDRLVHEAASHHTIEVHPVHLPDSAVTLLDVPGHVDWLAATVAGLGGASQTLLVVAADDGIMPQTRDHLTAMQALDLPLAAAVLTRVDLVAEDRVAVVQAQVTAELAARGFGAVVPEPVVAPSGIGVATIRSRLLACDPPHVALPFVGPDLWVDRSFLLTGRGRVVTGTLRRGQVAVGDVLVEGGTDRQVRIRGLQRRGVEVNRADAGDRVALLLAGGATTPRGARLLAPRVARHGLLGRRVDLLVHNLTDRPLKARGGWTAHAGTQYRAGRVRPWAPVAPGASEIATLDLDEPLPLRPGDRIVLRDTGRRVVAAGAVALASARRPRGDAATRHELARALRAGDPRAVIEALVACHDEDATASLHATIAPLDRPRRPSGERAGPVRPRSPRSDPREALVIACEAAGYCPPPTDTLLEQHGLDRSDRNHLVARGRLHVAGRFTFADAVVRDAARRLACLPAPFTVAQARDALGVTRRHAVPLLELLDRLGITHPDHGLRRTIATEPDMVRRSSR